MIQIRIIVCIRLYNIHITSNLKPTEGVISSELSTYRGSTDEYVVNVQLYFQERSSSISNFVRSMLVIHLFVKTFPYTFIVQIFFFIK